MIRTQHVVQCSGHQVLHLREHFVRRRPQRRADVHGPEAGRVGNHGLRVERWPGVARTCSHLAALASRGIAETYIYIERESDSEIVRSPPDR